MKQSKLFMPTLREVPSDAEAVSHQLLLRAGFMRQNAAGIYSYLPLAKRVLSKIETIVRQEMEAAGAQELLMPAIQPAELWEETGRWDIYGPELMRLTDRHDRRFALGATHEELITSIVRDELNSYKKLPVNLFQIQMKYRDERRPRFGLLRGREFIMKDAYSFHATQESLEEEYQNMFEAYTKIFTRVGLEFRPVVADSGAIGGSGTHEFHALAAIGEDTIVYSDQSDYAANLEMAESVDQYAKQEKSPAALEEVHTGDAKTIEAVSAVLGLPEQESIKTVVFKTEQGLVMALVRGDHEVNDIKLKNYLGALDIMMATDEEIEQALHSTPGTLGPIGAEMKIVADYAIRALTNVVCGANKAETHYIHVDPSRDFAAEYTDLRFVEEGDVSPDGAGHVKFARGIEVGQVFKLGTRYSEGMNATFLDEGGKAQPLIMGCYGIGVSRTMSAVVEQHYDERGIVWPKAIAPFDVHLIAVNGKNADQMQVAETVYQELTAAGFSVLFDDRKERAGVKFADADLIGLPVRINVGKKAPEGIVELKARRGGEAEEIQQTNLLEAVRSLYEGLQ
ncbi:proline--tRNA ligase [Exiguobacterium antarcticum]|uniref:Proline--tRNA ligase n=1 Tax=Exiguobacterium antarcticum TaxID=132920 RepID=A0ABT6QYX2_9BACL|nr:proline--tRNA ligase [Exiguobacterium antarcticum]AFS70803.1 Proline--tRNA ligase [Exiguobacterium antarcticum B7]MDI3233885.1 proline--tRNA ligase [Exiguobacterium antarcticum]